MTASVRERRGNRRQEILEILASELEKTPGCRVTTAALARSAGVSEAALYRHFPSKAKMFEALIQFAEETIFARVSRILADQNDTAARSEAIMLLVLTFSERNPGITRVLLGDALVGEDERLYSRVSQFFERLETTLRQVLREASLRDAGSAPLPARAGANLMSSMVEGRMAQYVRSRFSRSPTEYWSEEWGLLKRCLFDD